MNKYIVWVFVLIVFTVCSSQATPSRRVFILGIDGLDPTILEEFMDEELLPNFKALVKEGDIVKIGDTLFIMEVMKTEVNHDSPIDGTVTKVNIVNDQEGIDPGTIAIIID